MKIYTSKDYGRFVPPVTQRPVKENKVSSLAESMARHGYLNEFPVVVREKASKLQIVSGQHRVAAAYKAGVPIGYVIDNDISDQQILEMEMHPQNWNISDFAYAQAARGNMNYDVLIQFVNHYKIPMGVAANLLDGSQGQRNVREGTFVPSREKAARAVLECSDKLASVFDGARQSNFLYAMSRVIGVPGFDLNRFMSSKSGFMLLKKQRCQDDYIQMIEDVYNFHRPTKFPIAWKVKEEHQKLKLAALESGRRSKTK